MRHGVVVSSGTQRWIGRARVPPPRPLFPQMRTEITSLDGGPRGVVSSPSQAGRGGYADSHLLQRHILACFWIGPNEAVHAGEAPGLQARARSEQNGHNGDYQAGFNDPVGFP